MAVPRWSAVISRTVEGDRIRAQGTVQRSAVQNGLAIPQVVARCAHAASTARVIAWCFGDVDQNVGRTRQRVFGKRLSQTRGIGRRNMKTCVLHSSKGTLGQKTLALVYASLTGVLAVSSPQAMPEVCLNNSSIVGSLLAGTLVKASAPDTGWTERL